MSFYCKSCKKVFQTASGIYKHNRSYHPKIINVLKERRKIEQTHCKYCNKELSCYVSKWKHEKICKCNPKINGVINDMLSEIDNLKLIIKKSSNQIKEIKNKPAIININKPNINNMFDTQNCINVFKINNEVIQIYKNNYVDAIIICQKFNTNFNNWYNTKDTKDVILEIKQITNIEIDNLVVNNLNKKQILIHPLVAVQLFQWINPIYGLKFNNWLMLKNNEEKENTIEIKNNEIKSLVSGFVKKQVRTVYPQKNVIYLLTTEFHKKNNIYIIGKASNLKNRLSTYNKTCNHEVVYYKSCGKEDLLSVIENMVLSKLNPYREVANRDRFILPPGKNVSFFTNIIDQSIEFFNDQTIEQLPNNNQQIISKIQKLLDEINSQAHLFK